MNTPELTLTKDGNFCRAVGCMEPIANHLIMCGKDWRKVPPAMQERIYISNRMRSQRKPGAAKIWLAAVKEAIGEVARREGKKDKFTTPVDRLDRARMVGL